MFESIADQERQHCNESEDCATQDSHVPRRARRAIQALAALQTPQELIRLCEQALLECKHGQRLWRSRDGVRGVGRGGILIRDCAERACFTIMCNSRRHGRASSYDTPRARAFVLPHKTACLLDVSGAGQPVEGDLKGSLSPEPRCR